MYIPQQFRIEDPSILETHIIENSFGTLITVLDGAPYASHLPFLFDKTLGVNGSLLGHMARANPQWRQFEKGFEVLATFQGPHGYISPSWYQTSPAVPTWNYTAVHIYGIPTIVEGEELIKILRRTVSAYEDSREQPWRLDSLPEDYVEKMARAVVGFRVEITRIDGKFKLSQNRSAEDIENVITELGRSGDPAAAALARLMRENMS